MSSTKKTGSAFGFRITDGSEAAYQALGEDYTYLQKAMLVGEDTIASINASADKSTIDATSFPKSAGGVYLSPDSLLRQQEHPLDPFRQHLAQ
jgi:hypothetical protein